MFALVAFSAFESTAVTTIMPTVAAGFDGVGLYALSFAAPLASGVVGMVAAGAQSDRRGPVRPLVVAMALFALGLVICGTAPSMEVLVAGRVVQGLGGGAMTVCLYVVVGLVFPPVLQPAVFASFAAAWVLPSLFGPALAAFVAHAVGWRWVFLGVVALVATAGFLIAPALRRIQPRAGDQPTPWARLLWALVAAVAVLGLELVGSREGAVALLAVAALALVALALRRLLPLGTLRAARGLPAVIGTRGLMSASFFCTEAYVVYVLQDHWGLSPGQAGIALSVVGVTWAAASQLQARVGSRVSDAAAMCWGNVLLLSGILVLVLAVDAHLHPLIAAAAYVVAGAGMGFGYPRTGVAMLAASDDTDRGFNSAALSVADSLGGALALSSAGVVFAAAQRADADPFLAVFAMAAAVGVLGLIAAGRTGPARTE